MPKLDGLVQLMVAAPMKTSNGTEKRHWATDGVEVHCI